MEEGNKSKKTVFIGGIGDDVDETVIYDAFSTFGDVLDVQLPTSSMNPSQQSDAKHRGFAFVTYSSAGDAQDAIDNMDMNELRGRVIKVNIARPSKTAATFQNNRAIWESEEWLKEHAKPLAQSGGVQGRNQNTSEVNSEEGEDAAMEEDE